MTTVIGCIQQIPPDHTGDHRLDENREIEATASTYLEAVDKVEELVPDGWRIIYVRTVEQHSNND